MNCTRRQLLIGASALASAAALSRLPGIATAATTIPTDSAPPLLSPANRSSNVPLNFTLTWPAVPGATGYDLYFGKGDSPAYACRLDRPQCRLETLRPNSAYAWYVVPVTAATLTSGPIQTFATASAIDRDTTFAWPIRIAETIRALYPKPADLSGWNYTQGMVIDALCTIATQTGRDSDIDYARQWLDHYVDANGQIDPAAYDPKLYSLDRIRPGPALLFMYERTHDPRYRKAADALIAQMDQEPRTTDGGFWHRSTYPNQMWLDGIYMADTFLSRYAAATGQSKYFDEAVKQILLIHQHAHDEKTGLYYHGWDETRTRPWANKQTGASPEFWGRSIGWFSMAIADVLDDLPADHPGRSKLRTIFQNLCASLLKYQDHSTAMWFQIVDKPAAPRNYVETSCSLMFAAAFAHGALRAWLPPDYLDIACRAFRGILNREVTLRPAGTIDIAGTVTVGSLSGNGGTYDYYVSVPTATNDQKSLGAFMYLSMYLSECLTRGAP